MASVKVKFRPSSVNGKEGSIYYQVIHNRAVRQITADLYVHESEWNAGTSSVTAPSQADADRKHHLHIIQKYISRDVLRLENIIRDLTLKGVCSADAIVDGYRKQTSLQSFFNFMDSVIGQLKRLNRERTSETYASALSSFMRFRRNKDIQLDDMDEDLVMEYEAWLKTNGTSLNTVSFYMRILRTNYKLAVEKGLTPDRHPFRNVYCGIDKTVKRSLSFGEIKKISALDLSRKPSMDFARDMFMFSFCTRGMSFIDMAYLKKADLNNGCLAYRRKKTGQLMMIEWTKQMQDIIDKYKSDGTSYLLPIITSEDGSERRQYQNQMRKINRLLKDIANRAGLPLSLSMYYARHSWATIARGRDVPLAVISEGLGHDSETTTQIYLDSIKSSEVDKVNRMILEGL